MQPGWMGSSRGAPCAKNAAETDHAERELS